VGVGQKLEIHTPWDPVSIQNAGLHKKTGCPHAKGTACKNNEVFA
jgi:hypothetical protein